MEQNELMKLRFPKGMNNMSQETTLPEGQARRIVNLDITNEGRLLRRTGATKRVNGTLVHSLWSCDVGTYYVDNGTLYKLDAELNKTALATGLTPSLPVSYCEVNGTVYWANGQQQGKLVAGFEPATWQPGRIGEIVRYYNGRIYSVVGNTIYPTDALNYDRIDPFRNFISLPGAITSLAPVTGGIFVGVADHGTYFLSGPDYQNFSLTPVDDAIPARGSDIPVPGNTFGVAGDCYAWFTNYGWVAGLPGGSTKRLNDQVLSAPKYESVAALLRETSGMRQLVGFGRGGDVSSAAATDTVTTEVIRGGRLVI